MATSVTFIGGGKMGTALIGGMLNAGWQSTDISVVETDSGRAKELSDRFPQVVVVAKAADLEPADLEPGDRSEGVAVLAVKPGDAQKACDDVGDLRFGLLLSIMAGVTSAQIEKMSGTEVHVVRSMPNTPALIGAGVSVVAPGKYATEDDLAVATRILGAVGEVVTLPEKSLDAVTGLSGSGPAYIFLVAEALIDAGVLAGLPRQASKTLALQMIAGSARMLIETDDEPEQLRAQVTSPGGTTAAGLRALESRSVRSAFLEAVMAATDRSRQLGS